MKLLIITQKMDKEDGVFGFMHRWLEKFSQNFDLINVLCLELGEHALPSNAKVWSLGKEQGKSRIQYLAGFYKYIWKHRNDYDIVFVHMNCIYVILGKIFWKLWKKRIYLWYNHEDNLFINRLAFKLANKIFYTSPFSAASQLEKAKQMPAGIDTELFKRRAESEERKVKDSILFLGRISAVKKLEVLIEAVRMLDKDGQNFVLNVVGEQANEDPEYFEKIKTLSQDLIKKGKILFLGKVANYKTPKIYNSNQIFVNLTDSSSLDKTILEAMACQTLVLVSNKTFEKVLGPEFIFEQNNSQDLKQKISNVLSKTIDEKQVIAGKLRDYVIENHSLDILVNNLINEFQT